MFANCKWFSAEMMPEYGGKTGIMMDNSGLSMRSVCSACGALELTTVAASLENAINVAIAEGHVKANDLIGVLAGITGDSPATDVLRIMRVP